MRLLGILFILTIFVSSCREEVNHIPKPKGYFRIDFPERSYEEITKKCRATYERPTYTYIQDKESKDEGRCFQNIVFPYYKAAIYCTHIQLDSNDLYVHTEKYQRKVMEHRIKASGIQELEFIDPEKRVYGTTFDIQGDVACNYIFYLTDSTDNFFSGSLYFEAAPNYDSLQPVIEFIKEDIKHLIETFEWTDDTL